MIPKSIKLPPVSIFISRSPGRLSVAVRHETSPIHSKTRAIEEGTSGLHPRSFWNVEYIKIPHEKRARIICRRPTKIIPTVCRFYEKNPLFYVYFIWNFENIIKWNYRRAQTRRISVYKREYSLLECFLSSGAELKSHFVCMPKDIENYSDIKESIKFNLLKNIIYLEFKGLLKNYETKIK